MAANLRFRRLYTFTYGQNSSKYILGYVVESIEFQPRQTIAVYDFMTDNINFFKIENIFNCTKVNDDCYSVIPSRCFPLQYDLIKHGQLLRKQYRGRMYHDRVNNMVVILHKIFNPNPEPDMVSLNIKLAKELQLTTGKIYSFCYPPSKTNELYYVIKNFPSEKNVESMSAYNFNSKKEYIYLPEDCSNITEISKYSYVVIPQNCFPENYAIDMFVINMEEREIPVYNDTTNKKVVILLDKLI